MHLGRNLTSRVKNFLAYVKQQQDQEKQRVDEQRKERQRERQNKTLEVEKRERIHVRELEEKEKEQQLHEKQQEAERKHELAMKQLELQSANTEGHVSNANVVSGTKLPKLPTFVDGKNDLDSYLQRFERFAKNINWEESTWSISLSALLTGRALYVYPRLSETAAVDYKQLEEALLKRYELTENGFRVRFKVGKKFITKLNRYLTR